MGRYFGSFLLGIGTFFLSVLMILGAAGVARIVWNHWDKPDEYTLRYTCGSHSNGTIVVNRDTTLNCN